MTVGHASPLGAGLERVEARDKVTGAARYAIEHRADGVVYAFPVGATIAKGAVSAVATDAALALDGVVAVLWHGNAPRLQPAADAELALFQTDGVAYRGQLVAAVVADSLDNAREAARRLEISYAEQTHAVELRADLPGLYAPEKVNPSFPTDTALGDFDAAFTHAAVRVDATYVTPAFHNNPMEMHATLARWVGGDLELYDSTQGASAVRETIARLFGLDRRRVRVIAHHVGGAFGSKGQPHPHVVLAAMAAQVVDRPVKVTLTRQQLFAVAGYRTPTIQRLRLGAGRDGRLSAIGHDAIEQTSTVREFAEQTTVATRMMYAAPHRRTTHRLARLDVPTPSWMRAPGECPGMFALESAIDELALACELDPIELRIRNEPGRDPERDVPYSSRNLVACLRDGAERFGWAGRSAHRDGAWRIGSGVAASTYPAYLQPGQATARAEDDGYVVGIAATDIGTGARTVLTQIAADALDVGVERVRVEIGDSALPRASVAGGSSGTASWGSAVVKACRALRAEHGDTPPAGAESHADTTEDVKARPSLSRHAFGAQFAEVRVHADTGEVRVPRMVGVFAAGHVLNARTARSQLIGGMTMGVSMALHEESVMDPRFGDYVNHDLASYHIAACADIGEIDVSWVDEDDPDLNPMGVKGIGEIGIVGTAAAIANAVHHATGIRIRELPIRLDRLLAERG